MSYKESYDMQAKSFDNDLVDEKRKKIAASWFRKDTGDYWRHARAYSFMRNFEDKTSSWLTVGDGRWGLDAIRISEYGFKNVLATDISEVLLKEAKKTGKIVDYSIENAEKLSFADGSFDYVFCKEAFHHFPRPYIALYEMLRVAKKGVFLIEPHDPSITEDSYVPNISIGKFLRRKLKYMVLGKRIDEKRYKKRKSSFSHYPPNYEEGGNFIYNFSRTEAFKVAFGLNLPQLLFSGYNDHYTAGIEFEPADIEKSPMFKEMRSIIDTMDCNTRQGKSDYTVLMVGIMKEKLDVYSHSNFQNNDWTVLDLERNPYL